MNQRDDKNFIANRIYAKKFEDEKEFDEYIDEALNGKWLKLPETYKCSLPNVTRFEDLEHQLKAYDVKQYAKTHALATPSQKLARAMFKVTYKNEVPNDYHGW